MLHRLIKVPLRSLTLRLYLVAVVSESYDRGRVALILELEPKGLNLRRDMVDQQQLGGPERGSRQARNGDYQPDILVWRRPNHD